MTDTYDFEGALIDLVSEFTLGDQELTNELCLAIALAIGGNVAPGQAQRYFADNRNVAIMKCAHDRLRELVGPEPDTLRPELLGDAIGQMLAEVMGLASPPVN